MRLTLVSWSITNQYFSSYLLLIAFLWMDIPYFAYPFACWCSISKPFWYSTDPHQMLTAYLLYMAFDFILGWIKMFSTGTTIIFFIFVVRAWSIYMELTHSSCAWRMPAASLSGFFWWTAMPWVGNISFSWQQYALECCFYKNAFHSEIIV